MKNPVWHKVIAFALVIFFIRLADSLISFWAPDLIQSSLMNSFEMGLIISFQSIVGFAADLIFPALLRKGNVKKLTILAITVSALTAIFFYVSSLRPFVIFFLISVTAWGIYYELAGFGIYQFVDKAVPLEVRSGAWGILDIFRSLAYAMGPIIAVWVLVKGNIFLVILILILLFLAFFIFTFKNKERDKPLEPRFEEIRPWQETFYWITLFKYIWPIIVITLLVNFVDSTFWTTGVIWTVKLAKINPLGSLLLTLYLIPSLFTGLLVAKAHIKRGKKKLAIKFLIIAGIFLTALFLAHSVLVYLLLILASSIALAISSPLIESVYSDLIGRLGKGKKHLIGFNSAMTNMSYIIWPPIAGLIAEKSGEKITFVYMGILMLVVSIVLYFIMPKKLKLNQLEIGKWKN